MNKANVNAVNTALTAKLDKNAKAADSAKLNGQATDYYATSAALVAKADKGRQTRASITFINQATPYGQSFVQVNPFYEAILVVSCTIPANIALHGRHIASLPAGFRPVVKIEVPVQAIAGNSSCSLIITTDGKLTLTGNVTPTSLTYVMLTCSYPT